MLPVLLLALVLPAPQESAGGPSGERAALAEVAAAVEDLRPGRLDVELSDAEPIRRFSHRSDWLGTLHVWARSGDLDPRLLVTDPESGRILAEDDDGGGGTTAYVNHAVEPGSTLTVVLRSDEGRGGSVELHVVEARETPETLEAARIGKALAHRAGELKSEGRQGETRVVVTEAIARLMAVPGARDSNAIGGALHQLAYVAQDLAEFDAALEAYNQVWRLWSRHGSETHPMALLIGGMAAQVEFFRGHFAVALRIYEELIASIEAYRVDEPEILAMLRSQSAIVLMELGRLGEARGALEATLRICETAGTALSRSTSSQARVMLSTICVEEGDLLTARYLQEQLLAELEAEDVDPVEKFGAASALAATLLALGQAPRAAILWEDLLSVARAEYGHRHPIVLEVMANLASCESHQGRHGEAIRKVDEILSSHRPGVDPEGPWIELALEARAHALARASSHDEAQEAMRAMLRERSDRYAPGTERHVRLVGNLAFSLFESGELDEARDLLEEVLPEPELLEWRATRRNRIHYMRLLRALGDDEGAREAGRVMLEQIRNAVVLLAFQASPAEIDEQASRLRKAVAAVLGIAVGGAGKTVSGDPLVEDALDLLEAMRKLGAWTGAVAASLPPDRQLDDLRDEILALSARLASLSRTGGAAPDLLEARLAVDAARRQLLRHPRLQGIGDDLLESVGISRTAARLGGVEAVILYHRLPHGGFGEGVEPVSPVEHFIATVIRGGDALQGEAWTLVDLGPAARVEAAVGEWRRRLQSHGDREGESAAGESLRALVFDPLSKLLDGARSIECVTDEVLSLVPLDALPRGDARLGDEVTIRTRTMLHRLPTSELGGGLVAVGGITYATDSDEAVGRDAMARSPVLRETVWSRGFSALPGTLREIEAIAELYGASFPEGRSTVLSGREVTREAFIEAASGARFLHVATHGWFSPRPLPRGTAEDGVRGLATIWSDRVRALSPSSLCGLALAGANAAPDRLGQVPGLLTAEEVSALDLSACELAVLSACETGVGIAGAGVGVASLQKALHVAGARWVLTSLWKVDDRSALALMQSFYRGLWAEGLPPGEALWQAKNELRSRRRPPAEWAGWVLTSAPAAPTNGEAEEPTIRDR